MRVTPDYALYKMSFTNLIMYGAAIPMYDDEKEDQPEFDKSLDANDPSNFSEDEDEIIVRV